MNQESGSNSYISYTQMSVEQREQLARWAIQFNGVPGINRRIQEAFKAKYGQDIKAFNVRNYLKTAQRKAFQVSLSQECVMILARLVDAGEAESIGEAANLAIRMFAASKEKMFKIIHYMDYEILEKERKRRQDRMNREKTIEQLLQERK